jgi:transposase
MEVPMLRGLLTDDEWGFFEPFVVESGPFRGRPPGGHRRVLDAIFWVARTRIPWRDLPPELGHWNSVHRQYRRWTTSGLWDVLLQALADGGGDADALQMIDSTIIRAHHCAAGAKGGLTARILGARAVASRPRSTSVPMSMVCRSA